MLASISVEEGGMEERHIGMWYRSNHSKNIYDAFSLGCFFIRVVLIAFIIDRNLNLCVVVASQLEHYPPDPHANRK